MKVAVVGRGLIGAAAARHLVKAGHQVVLIGPDEPHDWASHAGAFASHYDEGRITRVNDPNPFYAKASHAAIGRYAEIAEESGISFFTDCGALIAGSPEKMETIAAAAQGLDVHSLLLTPKELADTFPFFQMPDGMPGTYEPRGAGHISPRRLVAAQCKAAVGHGAIILPVEATHVAEGIVRTAEGDVACDQVLVAAGGWTDTLLDRKQLTVRPRTIAFFAVDAAEVERLRKMPSLIVESANGTYLLPPIRYDDGRYWLKIGGDPVDHEVIGAEDINAWFRSGGDPETEAFLSETIHSLMPGLKVKEQRRTACVTSWTETGVPEIRRLSPGLTVATGGNGAGAKCSDELGRRGSVIATDIERVIA